MTNESEKTDAAIIVRDLRRRFGQHEVLRGVNLDCPRGEITTIVGPSGCGKTVLLKHLNLLLRPDSGQIIIDGIDVTKLGWRELDKVREKFGMLFQGGALFDSLTVFDNVAFPLIEKTRMSRDEIARRVSEMLRQVGLEAMENKYPSQLSGGMQKRVALARAIAAEPEIVFFDEPTTGLDPIMADVINRLIVSSVRELGATTVSITHDMVSARRIADRIAMLHKGRIVWQGPASEIDHTDNPFVDQFVNGRAEGPIQMEVRAA